MLEIVEFHHRYDTINLVLQQSGGTKGGSELLIIVLIAFSGNETQHRIDLSHAVRLSL
jgi:hypothetical protein